MSAGSILTPFIFLNWKMLLFQAFIPLLSLLLPCQLIWRLWCHLLLPLPPLLLCTKHLKPHLHPSLHLQALSHPLEHSYHHHSPCCCAGISFFFFSLWRVTRSEPKHQISSLYVLYSHIIIHSTWVLGDWTDITLMTSEGIIFPHLTNLFRSHSKHYTTVFMD